MKISKALIPLICLLSGFSIHAKANLCPGDSLARAEQSYEAYLNANFSGQAKLKYLEGQELMSEVFGSDLNPDEFLLDLGPVIAEEYIKARQLLRDLNDDTHWFRESYDLSRLASIVQTHINNEREDSEIEVKVRYMPSARWRLAFEVYYTLPARRLFLFSTRSDEKLLMRVYMRHYCMNCYGPIVIETLGQYLAYSLDGSEEKLVSSRFDSKTPPWFQRPVLSKSQQRRINNIGHMDFETFIDERFSDFLTQCIKDQQQEITSTSD